MFNLLFSCSNNIIGNTQTKLLIKCHERKKSRAKLHNHTKYISDQKCDKT